jgi:hypothetical protein
VEEVKMAKRKLLALIGAKSKTNDFVLDHAIGRAVDEKVMAEVAKNYQENSGGQPNVGMIPLIPAEDGEAQKFSVSGPRRKREAKKFVAKMYETGGDNDAALSDMVSAVLGRKIVIKPPSKDDEAGDV